MKNEKFISTEDASNILSIASNIGGKNLDELSQAILNNKIKIIYSNSKKPIGYIVWADIHKTTMLSSINYNYKLNYPYEWSEGSIAWIIDIAIIGNLFGKEIRKEIRKAFSNRVIYYRTDGKAKLIYKIKKLNINIDGIKLDKSELEHIISKLKETSQLHLTP